MKNKILLMVLRCLYPSLHEALIVISEQKLIDGRNVISAKVIPYKISSYTMKMNLRSIMAIMGNVKGADAIQENEM